MKFKLFESYLYHVTHTKKAGLIQRRGIQPMQTSNWIKGSGERYGQGEVYAFDNQMDALRWAAKMDWEFNQEMGSGKISIIRFKKSGDWEIDESDPISQAMNKGQWWKKIGPVSAEDIDGAIFVTPEMIKQLTKYGEDTNDLFH